MCKHIISRLKISGNFPTFLIPILFSYSNVELSDKNVTLPRKVEKRSSIDAETYTEMTGSSAGPLREQKIQVAPCILNTEVFFFCEGRIVRE